MKNIYCFKMPSGEEVIAKTNLPENWGLENTVVVDNAIMLVPTQQGVGAAPWPNSGENENVTINLQQVLAITRVRKELEAVYIQATSGIDVVSPQTSNLIM